MNDNIGEPIEMGMPPNLILMSLPDKDPEIARGLDPIPDVRDEIETALFHALNPQGRGRQGNPGL